MRFSVDGDESRVMGAAFLSVEFFPLYFSIWILGILRTTFGKWSGLFNMRMNCFL